MPVTRSSTRAATAPVNASLASSAVAAEISSSPQTSTPRKRKADVSLDKVAQKITKQDNASEGPVINSASTGQQEGSESAVVPAVLSFDFEEAKRHLIQVDHRFEDLFSKMKCKPFEQLEQVHPFR